MSPISSMSTRREVLAASAAGAIAMITSPGFAETVSTRGRSAAIRPFRIHVADADLDDLQRRLKAARWPERETVKDATQGVRLATMQALVHYWRTEYDWRKCEAYLNGLPQFVTEIDGLDIHFIHIRSKHANALPAIVTHGWPGSIIEQLKIIAPLTDPTAHGGSAAEAFDLVIPSLPGHGFSGKPTAAGWDPIRIARAWGELMTRLGYTRYVAQGGDWGNAVTEQMALQTPPGLIAIHTNMPATLPDEVSSALASGGPAPSGLSADERYAWDQLDFFWKHGLAYAQEMANRPQTLYALADSPVGLAAWMLDHDARSYDLIARVFDGKSEGLSKEDIVDNIALYWLTNTAVSSARLYWESKLAFFAPKGVPLPTAVSAFPDEIYTAPRSWAEKAYPKLIYYNRLPKGGHFAAWEQPKVFANELRAAFGSFHSA
ncbi:MULTISPECIES: epoxide hydrolase family protein [unclassified Mesorhizobium]|uniref:epoxide hydrolase family protein n=1 Tax=unclassified Mesorhizobium TaxID=325217 RepID=UPI003335C3A1